jgi:predicted PolB exonuclease-like 3'-5' exonuclease
MLGLPGKMGMSGVKVWEAFQAGDITAICDYCETDVLSTYLIYLRFEMLRGQLSTEVYQQECQRARDALAAMKRPHLNEFLACWQ